MPRPSTDVGGGGPSRYMDRAPWTWDRHRGVSRAESKAGQEEPAPGGTGLPLAEETGQNRQETRDNGYT